jgi:hypothetical protein
MLVHVIDHLLSSKVKYLEAFQCLITMRKWWVKRYNEIEKRFRTLEGGLLLFPGHI